MARLDAEAPVTRAELEVTLRAEGFRPQAGADHVWWSQDRTKFVCFPDGDSGEAIYGDSEIGEPGKTIPITTAHRVVRGELLLESPLGVSPVQRPADRLDGGWSRALPPRSERPRLRTSHIKALPAAPVMEAEFEEPTLDQLAVDLRASAVSPAALRELGVPELPTDPKPGTWAEAARSPTVFIAAGVGVGFAVGYAITQPPQGPALPFVLVPVGVLLTVILVYVFRRRSKKERSTNEKD